MPVEIVLVRHGQSEGNRDRRFTGHSPSRLTTLGHRQADATARALAAHPVTGVYSSDLLRCVETAAPLAGLTGLRPVETEALRERDVGAFTGLDFATVKERYPDGWALMAARDPHYRPPGGESHADCGHRVGRFLDELLGRHEHGRIVLYSHGVAINHLLRHALGVAAHEATTHFSVENCSIHRLEHRAPPRIVRVLVLNDTAHLAGLG